ncbi:MAG: ActP [Geobacteraceae bacterium]|nr:MAG: ActP [Geobacteraceae bacterium]
MRRVTHFIMVFALASVLMAPFVSAGEIKQQTKETTITVRGMVCSSCADVVEKALRKLDGVAQAKVELKNDRVGVRYDEKRVTPRQMVEAIRQSGYEARWPGK